MSATRDSVFGCLLSTSRLDRDGYAFHGKTRAHIHAWTSRYGVIPEGMEVEHECRRRNCVEPAHLRLVTRSENEKRKRWKYRARIAKCKDGHDMQLNAVVTPEGGRVCRQCNREAMGATT